MTREMAKAVTSEKRVTSLRTALNSSLYILANNGAATAVGQLRLFLHPGGGVANQAIDRLLQPGVFRMFRDDGGDDALVAEFFSKNTHFDRAAAQFKILGLGQQ